MKSTLLFLLTLTGIASAQIIETNWETGVILLPVKDAATHEMLRASLRATDPLVRIQGIVSLQTIRDPADAPLLHALRNDPVVAVREQALGVPPVAAKPPELPANAEEVRRGLRQRGVLQQQLAVQATAKLKLTELAPELLPFLESSDSVLRRHVCSALGALRVEQSPALAKQLAHDDDPLVRRAAADALLAIHSSAARDALVELLKSDKPSVRTEAARGLGDWKEASVAVALHPLLLDPDGVTARTAAHSIGKLGNPTSRQPLLEALQKRQDYPQDQIAWALGELRATEAGPALLQTLVGPNGMAQTSAADALGKLGDPKAIPALRKVLVNMKEHSPDTRERAIEALRRLGDRDSKKRVMQIITEKVVPPPPGSTERSFDMDDTRAEGLRYLQFLGDRALADEVLEKLEDLPSYTLRQVLAETVGKLRGKRYRAEFTVDCRRYLMESLAGEYFPKPPPLPGIVLVESGE